MIEFRGTEAPARKINYPQIYQHRFDDAQRPLIIAAIFKQSTSAHTSQDLCQSQYRIAGMSAHRISAQIVVTHIKCWNGINRMDFNDKRKSQTSNSKFVFCFEFQMLSSFKSCLQCVIHRAPSAKQIKIRSKNTTSTMWWWPSYHLFHRLLDKKRDSISICHLLRRKSLSYEHPLHRRE